MAQLAKASHRPIDSSISFEDYSSEGFKKADDYVSGLRLKSAKKNPDDPNCDIKGTILMFPIADGWAFYIVTNDKPLTVQHIPVGDAWTVPAVTLKGINRKYVLDQIRADKKILSA